MAKIMKDSAAQFDAKTSVLIDYCEVATFTGRRGKVVNRVERGFRGQGNKHIVFYLALGPESLGSSVEQLAEECVLVSKKLAGHYAGGEGHGGGFCDIFRDSFCDYTCVFILDASGARANSQARFSSASLGREGELKREPSAIRLVFAKNGYRIQRCGSGTLAAAKVLESKRSLPLSVASDAGAMMLAAPEKKSGAFAYIAPILKPVVVNTVKAVATTNSLTTKRLCSARLWQQVVNRTITAVQTIGGDRDYCLLVLSDEKALRQVTVQHQKLCALSARALIVTAPSNNMTYDYVIRYFAPQYGVQEDAATGSANAQAASYWQRRLRRSRVRGRQWSSNGGDFIVKRQGIHQKVMGQTTLLPQRLDASILQNLFSKSSLLSISSGEV